MKKVKSKYVIFDTFTGDMVMFVATETRAKKLCEIYDTFDYYEKPNLFDRGLLNSKHKKKEIKRD